MVHPFIRSENTSNIFDIYFAVWLFKRNEKKRNITSLKIEIFCRRLFLSILKHRFSIPLIYLLLLSYMDLAFIKNSLHQYVFCGCVCVAVCMLNVFDIIESEMFFQSSSDRHFVYILWNGICHWPQWKLIIFIANNWKEENWIHFSVIQINFSEERKYRKELILTESR